MKKDWQKSEDKTAKIYGKKQPASGSLWDKCDVKGLNKYKGLFCENKFTKNKSRSLKLEELQKAQSQAGCMGGEFFFLIDFNHRHRFILCSENYWINVHEELDELRQKVSNFEK